MKNFEHGGFLDVKHNRFIVGSGHLAPVYGFSGATQVTRFFLQDATGGIAKESAQSRSCLGMNARIAPRIAYRSTAFSCPKPY
jgi:hypothetical protein